MKKMNYAEPIINEYNAIVGCIIAIATYVFGEHWYLFAAYLALNVADMATGWLKSKLKKKESSVKGLQGLLKKSGYWVMIILSFGCSAIFIEIGKVIGVDLHITTLLGWFVLASLLINEIRSVIENLVEAGYKVPKILTNGLEVAEKVLDDLSDDSQNDEMK